MLWKEGGIYLDLDTINLKSFSPIMNTQKSGLGYQFDGYDNLNNAILIFSKKKHPFLEAIINDFIDNYNPNLWEINGPILFHHLISKFCNIDTFLRLELVDFKPASFSMNKTHQCADLVMFPENYFLGIAHVRGEHFQLFEPNSSNNLALVDKVRNSYLVHYYNQLAPYLKARVGDKSLIMKLIEENCKHTFNFMKKNNLEFQ